jgi:hypothetical protein
VNDEQHRPANGMIITNLPKGANFRRIVAQMTVSERTAADRYSCTEGDCGLIGGVTGRNEDSDSESR